MCITLLIKAWNKQKQNKTKTYQPIYNKQINKNIYTSAIKNLQYRYVTIKIHSTISKLKKVRLKIALQLKVCKFGISRSSILSWIYYLMHSFAHTQNAPLEWWRKYKSNKFHQRALTRILFSWFLLTWHPN